MPQLYADIDRTKVKSLGIPLEVVFNTLPGLPRLGLRQRLQPVRPDVPGCKVQADQKFRLTPGNPSPGWRSAAPGATR
ncbi:MAG: hypothetical protein U0835_02735 [Isosphaeraceae bacterium]